jgi:hypothetical protein
MKPCSKIEACWKYWREEGRSDKPDRFKSWAKKQMVKARRRFGKEVVRDELDSHVDF